MSIERVTIAPGLEVSRIWKGGWHLVGGHGDVTEDDAIDDMRAYVEASITIFDVAATGDAFFCHAVFQHTAKCRTSIA